MKKLNNRYKRNLRSSMSFYISLSFLTCVTVLMYLLFSSAVHCENIYVQNLFNENNVEDGQFTTYGELSNEDIEELEEEYDVLVERQDYVSLEEENYKVRLFSFTEKINIPEVTAKHQRMMMKYVLHRVLQKQIMLKLVTAQLLMEKSIR